MHNNILMGVKFWTSWRNFQEFSKSHYYGDFFQKWSPTCFFESEWVFGPLIFFNVRYIKVGVLGNNNIGIKKCTKKFLMGVKFWTSWRVSPTIFKITLLRWLFSKMVSNLWFFENLQGIFYIKLKAIFFNGISFENWRRFQKKIKGISFVKFYPRASLARAAFIVSEVKVLNWKWSESECILVL